ncbi:MAG TPA: SRPBCC domain-containing protein, partial [Capillimicrobium sp.]
VVDERVGGRHDIEFLGADGQRHAFQSTIVELVPDERVVLDFAFQGPEDGLRVDGTVLTITLADAPGGGTELRLVHERVAAGEQLNRENVTAGWGGAIDHLEALWADHRQETA